MSKRLINLTLVCVLMFSLCANVFATTNNKDERAVSFAASDSADVSMRSVDFEDDSSEFKVVEVIENVIIVQNTTTAKYAVVRLDEKILTDFIYDSYEQGTSKELLVHSSVYREFGNDQSYSIANSLTLLEREERYYPFSATSCALSSYGYDSVGAFFNGISVVSANGSYGAINELGEEILSPIYSDVSVSEGIIKTIDDSGSCFFNAAGDNITPVGYSAIYGFSEGMGAIIKDRKYGFINTYGDIIADAMYSDASVYVNGYAFVRTSDHLSGYLNKEGHFITNEIVKGTCSHVVDNIAVFTSGGSEEHSYFNLETGTVVALPEVTGFGNNGNCLSKMYITTKSGPNFLESTGEYKFAYGLFDNCNLSAIATKIQNSVENPHTNNIVEFAENADGMYMVYNKTTGLYGLCDAKTGQYLDCKYTKINVLHNGFAAFIDGKAVFFNFDLEQVLPCEYDSISNTAGAGVAAEPAPNHLAYVQAKKGTQYTLFTAEGNEIYTGSSLHWLGNGMFRDSKSTSPFTNGIFNVLGQKVLTAGTDFDLCGNYYNGISVCKLGDKYGAYDTSGKLAVPFEYDELSDFKGGYAVGRKNSETDSFSSALYVLDTAGNVVLAKENAASFNSIFLSGSCAIYCSDYSDLFEIYYLDGNIPTFSGGASEPDPGSELLPKIVDRFPERNAVDISTIPEIEIKFSVPVAGNLQAIKLYEYLDGNDSLVVCDITQSEDKTAIMLSPKTELNPSSRYYIMISPNAITDSTGAHAFAGISVELQWAFTTAPALSGSSIFLDNNRLIVEKGATASLAATTSPESATVSWKSSDTNIVTVDSSGSLAAVGEGEATITASIKVGKVDLSDSCTVHVTNAKSLNLSDYLTGERCSHNKFKEIPTIKGEALVNEGEATKREFVYQLLKSEGIEEDTSVFNGVYNLLFKTNFRPKSFGGYANGKKWPYPNVGNGGTEITADDSRLGVTVKWGNREAQGCAAYARFVTAYPWELEHTEGSYESGNNSWSIEDAVLTFGAYQNDKTGTKGTDYVITTEAVKAFLTEYATTGSQIRWGETNSEVKGSVGSPHSIVYLSSDENGFYLLSNTGGKDGTLVLAYCEYEAFKIQIADQYRGYKGSGAFRIYGPVTQMDQPRQITLIVDCTVEMVISLGEEELNSAENILSASFGTMIISDSPTGKHIEATIDYNELYSVKIFGTGEGTMDFSVQHDDDEKIKSFVDVPITSETVIETSRFNAAAGVSLIVTSDGQTDVWYSYNEPAYEAGYDFYDFTQSENEANEDTSKEDDNISSDLNSAENILPQSDSSVIISSQTSSARNDVPVAANANSDNEDKDVPAASSADPAPQQPVDENTVSENEPASSTESSSALYFFVAIGILPILSAIFMIVKKRKNERT